MVEALKFICGDFWNFVEVCIMLIIFAMWHPIQVKFVFNEGGDEDESNA